MKNLTIENTEVKVEMSIGWRGYGQYSITAHCTFEGKRKTVSFHSTDSELFDKRKDDEISYEEYQEMLFNRISDDLEINLEEIISETI